MSILINWFTALTVGEAAGVISAFLATFTLLIALIQLLRKTRGDTQLINGKVKKSAQVHGDNAKIDIR